MAHDNRPIGAQRLPFVVYPDFDAFRAEFDRASFRLLDRVLAEGWEPELLPSWEVEREAFLRGLDATGGEAQR